MYSAVTLYNRLLCTVQSRYTIYYYVQCVTVYHTDCVSMSYYIVCTVFVILSGDSAGGMELRVGSNMIIFRYVFPLLIWHVYFFGVCVLYIMHC